MTTSLTAQQIFNLVSGPLALVGMFYPPAAPFIAIAQQVIPAAIAAAPKIKEAVENGKSAWEAAQHASPQLGNTITAMLGNAVQSGTVDTDKPAAVHLENITRSLVGLGHMTAEQERDWMDKSTAFLNDSRSGSA